MQWEYETDTFYGYDHDFLDWLNRRGEGGWELVYCKETNGYKCYFKRAVTATDRRGEE